MDQDLRRQLIVKLQRGIPPERRPFAAVGKDMGVSEEAVLSLLCELFDSGKARRFGAVLDGHRLGYRSALCAVKVRDDDMERMVAPLLVHPGVTHCYQRGWPDGLPHPDNTPFPVHEDEPNLWFTLSHPASRFEAETARIQEHFGTAEVYILPALRRFKIDVILGNSHQGQLPRPKRASRTDGEAKPPHRAASPPDLTPRDIAIIRALQGNLPICEEPFAEVAQALNCSVDALLQRLGEWQVAGLVRRTGLVLNHRKSGFTANGMCAWPVPNEKIGEAGGRVAANPEVTHCYQRARIPSFPFDLYAMIHTGDWRDTLDLFATISKRSGLTGGRVLFSIREFKKTSPIFFAEGS